MKKDKKELLNKIVENNLNNEAYDIYREVLDYFENVLEPLYNNSVYLEPSNHEVNYFSINQSIDICYKFIKSFNCDLAERFMNILHAVDENNNNLVRFTYSQDEENCLDQNSIVNISLNNTAFDARCLIHEVFHKINQISMSSDDKKYYSYTNRIYTETVSIIAETLLEKYMYDNHYINDYEYICLLNDRINCGKLAANILIIEKELLKIKKNNMLIDEKSLLSIVNNELTDDVKKSIFKNEIKNNTIINNICGKGYMEYPNALGYAIGQVYTELFSEREDKYEILFQLNNLISRYETNVYDVQNDFINKKLIK